MKKIIDIILNDEVAGMGLKALETPSVHSLERAMDFSAARAEVLTQNIANVNTPNYKRMDVDFSAVLAQTMAENQVPLVRTNAKHFPSGVSAAVKPQIIVDSSTKQRLDGNNVDVEFEMAQIAENSMYFQSLTTMWKQEMGKLKMAIEGRS